MKTVSKLSLLAMTLIAAGCNEKVSPELMNSNATTPDGVAIEPATYYFSVTNTSSALLNHNLHKTGAGNQSAACEVKSNYKLSSDTFRGAPTANDITCYFDAEELSLLHGGMDFSINASANTCDYVGYSPFSFYDRIPGNSSGTYQEILCGDDTNSGHVAAAYPVSATGGATLGCNELTSMDIAAVDRVKFTISSDDELCRFNYESVDGENCDIGMITVNTQTVTFVPADDNNAAYTKSEPSTRVIDCGGKIEACVKGPITEITKSLTRVTEITNTELNTPFVKEYELKPLYGVEAASTVKSYANFRRNLASKNIDYIASTDNNYKSSFSNSILGKTFDPQVVDFYAANKRFDGTPLITPAIQNLYSYPNDQFKAVPYAADPFLGLNGYRVNPFYTFYCFDTAFDVKARIRMVVREWDRVSPAAQYNDYLSDIWDGVNSRQDNPTEVELPDEQDPFFLYNDLSDWDDSIPMQRTAGSFDAFTTIWQPLPSGTYLDGWFNPALFTNGNF
ncbi:MAG: hypothetical protein NDI69_17830 [Bacteriovoracaceae bacterium]|nr:hypothetical protein [Bacteriovoracaceae bacterium]